MDKTTRQNIAQSGINPTTGQYLSTAQRKMLFKKTNVSASKIFGKSGAIVKASSTKLSPAQPQTGGIDVVKLEKRVSILETQFSQLSKNLVKEAEQEQKNKNQLKRLEGRESERQNRKDEEKQIESAGKRMAETMTSPIKGVGGKAMGFLERIMSFFKILFVGWLSMKGIKAIKAWALGDDNKLDEIKNSVLKNLGIVAAIFVGIQGGLLALPAIIGGVVKAIATVGGLIVKLLLSPAGLISMAGLGLSYVGEFTRGLGDKVAGDGSSWWRNIAGYYVDVLSGSSEVVGAPFRALFEFVKGGFDISKSNEVMASVDANIRESFRKGLNRIDFLNIIPDKEGSFGTLSLYGDAGKRATQRVASGDRTNMSPSGGSSSSSSGGSSSSSSGGNSKRNEREGSGEGAASSGSLSVLNHPDTGSGYGLANMRDSQGRPVVFSKNAGEAFARMVKDSNGQIIGADVASSMRSPAKNAEVNGATRSRHMSGTAIDIHGKSGAWIRANGAKYGWVPNDYSGTHGGHYIYVGTGGGLPPAGVSPSPTRTPTQSAPGPAPTPPPNVVYKKVGSSSGGAKQPMKTGSATDIPSIRSSNPDNFYTLYSQVNYNVVI